MNDLTLAVVARIDPPEDVRQMVAGAIEVCHAWQPVVVQGQVHNTVESGVCNLIDDWPVHANAAGKELLWIGAFCGVVGFLILRMAYRTTCSLYRIVRIRVGRKARSV